SVAVVGAGIGGSTASFFLREHLGENVNIIVFEESEKPGGRTDDFVHNNETYETGASIIYTGNAYLFNLTNVLGLKRIPPNHSEGANVGFWNGEQFELITSAWKAKTLFKMAWRYRRSLLTIRSMVHTALTRFDAIYSLQAEGRFFKNPEQLWGK
ncbi:unnamed protein product, partial [Choristocarpus tenellus]